MSMYSSEALEALVRARQRDRLAVAEHARLLDREPIGGRLLRLLAFRAGRPDGAAPAQDASAASSVRARKLAI